MKKKKPLIKVLAVFLTLLLGTPQGLMAQSSSEAPQEAKAQGAAEAAPQGTSAEKPFKQEELDQLLAPIALYPDSLLTQVLMASTYPLEIVQANRWAKENKDKKGDALAKALEEQPWDPSVKSLVNFPDVLTMMSEKLDLTQKLGDAFLAQQKEVMDTVQNLRTKAEASGNLKTTEEQKVIVEKETIIIESADPQVIYVPSYNPTVVYGAWWYPAYPPYPYYPPGYGTGAAFWTGVAVGVAWGYAWGHANWHGGDVNININRNTNINNNINRDKYKNQGKGQGKWQHDASHRGGVAYKDQGTAQKYNRGTGSEAAKSREAYRGKAEAGRQDIARGGADQMRSGSSGSRQGAAAPRNTSSMDRGGTQAKANNSAFGSSAGGAQTRSASSRGNQSMSSSRGGGGGARGGGGGRRR
ncbi:MAG: hypothetical protein AMJ61_09600 [Desulfobacterales bacterium SG8_35_2]|nr:MAG: hypothetical protein AMJ61_09600 [Desulfobacterales bacterium SG8_35_2]